MRFLLREPSKKFGPYINAEFREKLFRGSEVYGIDLAALIIQMGRDHGLNGYTKWRNICGLSRLKSFNELKEIVKDEFDVELLKEVYETVDDIDLFIMGLAEKPTNGALLGPTFSCIISRQFEKVKVINNTKIIKNIYLF